jgi:hypothetical protein
MPTRSLSVAKKRYDVCWGQKDAKSDKVHWKQIGVVLQTDKGFSLKLEMIPTGWDGWAVLYEPKAKEEPKNTSGIQRNTDPDDEDVPF